MTLPHRPAALDDVDLCELHGHLLVHDPRARRLHALNASAALVLEACDGSRTVAQVVERVAHVAGGLPDELTAHVRGTIADLVAGGLVADGPPTDPPTDLPVAPTARPAGPAARPLHQPVGTVLRIRAIDHLADIECPDTTVRSVLAELLDPLLGGRGDGTRYQLVPEPPGHLSLWVDGRLERGAGPPEAAVRHLLWHVNHQAVTRSTGALLLHAGAVVVDGRAVLLAGEPDAGKSTLTSALVHRGASYLTDEAAIVDLDHRMVHPYPKPVSLDAAAVRLLHGLAHPGALPDGVVAQAERLGHIPATRLGAVTDRPVPVGAVVLPDRRDGRRQPEALAPVSAALALAAVSFNLDRCRQAGLDALTALACGVPVVRLGVGDLAEAVDDVLALVAAC